MKIHAFIFTAFCCLMAAASTALAQGTAFTYQGELNIAGAPASGSYDMSFALFATNTGGTAIDGPVTNTAVNVTNGLFTTSVDFGSVLTGASTWLQIAVSTNGANAFTNLAPRQQLTPTPYSLYAESANASGLTGALVGNGSGLTNLTASQLTSGTVADARLSTNVALLNASQSFSGANNFGSGVGITGANILKFGAGLAGQQVDAGKIGYEIFTPNSLDIVGAGTNGNSRRLALFAEGGSVFSGAIGLLGAPVNGASGLTLMNSNNGAGNQQLWITESTRSAPASNNVVVRIAPFNGGGVGYMDALSTDLTHPTNLLFNPLGGDVGINTFAPGKALQVGGPAGSEGILRLASAAAVGGAGRTWDVGVPNGGTNTAGKFFSFAIQDTAFTAPAFMIRWDSGYVGIGTTNPASLLHVRQTGNYNVAQLESDSTVGCWLGLNNTAGGQPWSIISSGSANGEGPGKLMFYNPVYGGSVVQVSTNGNVLVAGELTTLALNVTSDRNAKEHFTPVNAREVLDKVARLPITEWQYKQDKDDGEATAARHIGPVAQDFREAFTLGHDEKHISIIDENGVALAAIQGLNQKLEQQVHDQAAEVTRLKSENQALADRLAAIEHALHIGNSPASAK